MQRPFSHVLRRKGQSVALLQGGSRGAYLQRHGWGHGPAIARSQVRDTRAYPFFGRFGALSGLDESLLPYCRPKYAFNTMVVYSGVRISRLQHCRRGLQSSDSTADDASLQIGCRWRASSSKASTPGSRGSSTSPSSSTATTCCKRSSSRAGPCTTAAGTGQFPARKTTRTSVYDWTILRTRSFCR
jgi:hypothetical protein